MLHSHRSNLLSHCRHARKATIVHCESNHLKLKVFHTVTKCTTFSLQTCEKGHHSTLKTLIEVGIGMPDHMEQPNTLTDTTNDKRWKMDPSFASAKLSNQPPCYSKPALHHPFKAC